MYTLHFALIIIAVVTVVVDIVVGRYQLRISCNDIHYGSRCAVGTVHSLAPVQMGAHR